MSEDVFAEDAKFYACAHTGGMVLVPLNYACTQCVHDVDSTIVSSLDAETEIG